VFRDYNSLWPNEQAISKIKNFRHDGHELDRCKRGSSLQVNQGLPMPWNAICSLPAMTKLSGYGGEVPPSFLTGRDLVESGFGRIKRD
jgi:hypothetical protein